MVSGPDAEKSVARPSDLPPPYESATTDNGTGDCTSEQRPFIPYTDDKRPAQGTRKDVTGGQLSASDLTSQAGRPPQSSKYTGKEWSGSPRRISSIAPSLAPGQNILRTRCFHSKSQRLRLALATNATLQVYDALRDSLLWELHGNSSQLVQGSEEPLRFGEGFRPSPDGSLLCAIASQRNQKRLLIMDTESGWVKTEFSLSPTDGNKPHFSPDNATVVLCHSGGVADGTGYFKIFSLDGERGNVARVPFTKPAAWQSVGTRFTPDSKHIIACAGPTNKVKDAAPSVSVCVYSVQESGRIVRLTNLACSSKFNSTSQKVKFAADFHFPAADEWLVSFPDYSGPGKTCIVNARLGQIVAVFSSDLTLSQKWQVGVLPPTMAHVSHDGESGIFTRMEVNSTIIPRGQTVTVTKFALSANGGRERAVLRKAFQIRAVVLSCRHGDVCGLSHDGSHMFVQQGPAGKIDLLSLAM